MHSPRWIKIALVISLALNLAVIGLIAGAVFKHGPGGPVARTAASFGPYPDALTPDQRAAFFGDVRGRSEDLRAHRRALRGAFGEVMVALRAEPFDPEMLRSALDRQNSAVRGRQAALAEALVDRVSDMSLDERQAFADRLRQVVRRGGPRDEKDGGRE